MFNLNKFKSNVRIWIKENPVSTELDLIEYCEKQVPIEQLASNAWLIEETIHWCRYVFAMEKQKEFFNNR